MIVTFQDYVPVARYDGTAWNTVLVEEAASEAGPFTLIDTIALSPLDTDPTMPRARSFTTELATLVDGWYRISFKDAAGNVLQTDPVQNESSDISYLPTIGQVARKILSRTRDKYGNLVGTFTPDTLPTDTQVAAIITDVSTQVADVIGDDVNSPFIDDAKNVVALLAAMQIELNFYSEQVNSNRSTYPQLLAQYEASLQSLSAAIQGDNPDTPGVDPTAVATRALFASPTQAFFTRDQVW